MNLLLHQVDNITTQKKLIQMIFNSMSYTSLTRYTLKKKQQHQKKTKELQILKFLELLLLVA